MIITLTRSGGFIGIPLKKTIDTSKLPVKEAKTIENLAQNIPTGTYAKRINQKTNPDRFTYTLSIQDEEISQEITISEDALDDTMTQLISSLESIDTQK